MKKRKKRGPVPPACGRIRITVNLPRSLLPFLKGLEGESLSKKIVGLIQSSEKELSLGVVRNIQDSKR